MRRFIDSRSYLIWLTVLLVACQANRGDEVVINTGSLRAEVRALMGEPVRVQEFILPESPFFGPQESLTGLLPAGTPVEEWVYAVDEMELYVWFAVEDGQAEDQWRVVEMARYPAGAVY
jgi:hypothetical protein